MNLGKARIVLRLRPLTDILDLALRVCAENARLYRKLSLLLLLPAFATMLALRYFADWSWWTIWPLSIALAALASGPFTIAAGQLVFEDASSARAVVGRWARRLWRMSGTLFFSRLLMICYGLLIVAHPPADALITLSVIAAMIVPLAWMRWAFVHEAVLLEGARAGAAMSRAGRIGKRHSSSVIGLFFWIAAAQVSFVTCAELIGQGVVRYVFQLGQPLGSLWSDGGSVFALAGFFLSVPFVATARFLQYIDLRTRKEGWDIQVRFAARQAEDAAGRSQRQAA